MEAAVQGHLPVLQFLAAECGVDLSVDCISCSQLLASPLSGSVGVVEYLSNAAGLDYSTAVSE